MSRVLKSCVLGLCIFSFFLGTGTKVGAEERSPHALEAQQVDAQSSAGAPRDPGSRVSIIVKLDVEPLASQGDAAAGLAPTGRPTLVKPRLSIQSASSRAYLGHVKQRLGELEAAVKVASPDAQLTHRYDVVLGGFALVVSAADVPALEHLPGVKAVYRDELLQLETNKSPSFIGANDVWAELGGREAAGEGVVVALLDSGIWPEHPSFSDPDPSGKPYPAPPATWNGGAGPACEPPTDGSAEVRCNNKLIGARKFLDGYKARFPLLAGEFDSPRDSIGHGTHTASTAAGNSGVSAKILGRDQGKISGIAPRARVAMYRVCADRGCASSDVVAAIQQAVLDGVDVINLSISGGFSPYTDPVELALLDAYEAGIFVAAAAGNSGVPDTVAHRGPWVTTVAASTEKRIFTDRVTLAVEGRDTLKLEGVSVTAGTDALPLVVSEDLGDPLCRGPFAKGSLSGRVIACERGGNSLLEKGRNVLDGGAAGMILYNLVLSGVGSLTHFLPASHLEVDAATRFFDFLATHSGVTARLSQGKATPIRGDVVALFSSRGGPEQVLGISKPDVAAPGDQILAAYTPAPHFGVQNELFRVDQGTSMSAPHVAGAAALLRELHPTWTPGQIKSALMTTARSRGILKEDRATAADPFDVGSGRIDLRRASDPGLTFDVAATDYRSQPDELQKTNYPSIYLNGLSDVATVTRTARSLLAATSVWTVSASAPGDVKIIVPRKITVPAGGDAAFDITVDAREAPVGEVRSGAVELSRAGRKVRLPVTLTR